MKSLCDEIMNDWEKELENAAEEEEEEELDIEYCQICQDGGEVRRVILD